MATKKPKLGSGERSAAIKKNVVKEYTKKGMSKKKAEEIAGGVIHKQGVKKYGQKKMTQMAVAGRKRASKKGK